MAGRTHSNKQTALDRAKLVHNFEQRFRDHEPVGTLKRPKSVAIVVHPTADDTVLLQQIGWEPSRCESVNAYFRYQGSVYWVEVFGQRVADRPPGIYYLFDRGHRQDVLKVVLPHPLVYSWDLHHAFDRIEALVDSGALETMRPAFAGAPLRTDELSDPPKARPRAVESAKP